MSDYMKERMDQFDRHEALDRCSMLCNIIDQELMGHRYFEHHTILKSRLEEAFELIYGVYQAIPLNAEGAPEDDVLRLKSC
jgi:hypothetical protein